jgi:hypothetical protein
MGPKFDALVAKFYKSGPLKDSLLVGSHEKESKDMLLYDIEIAQVAHQVNKAYCESLGDFFQVDWAQAPDNIKGSAVNGVNYLLDNPKATPENSHENWLKFKRNDGWVYGPVKDSVAKTHPCMVPYAELPTAQKAKDAIYHAIVRTLAKF